ncbi:MAG: MotA/TolQ/ExbB proton channel family protein [Ignavibacteriales bacterium]|nr:MotA/TolQ/ExbB proton channel family protein [Ignavibacteriales bacterium]
MKRTIDIGTIGGLMFGIMSIFGSFMLEGGEVGALMLAPAMVIVFGGTFATAFIGNSMESIKDIGKVFGTCMFPPRYNSVGVIDTLVKCSIQARKDGLLSLEKEISRTGDPFLKKMLQLVIDGTDTHVLHSLAETEVTYLSERNLRDASIFVKMGGYSPTMGIIGTVMGLIATLASAGEDPNVLIRHIASAFIATLWGVFMANIVWLPLADKLKTVNAQEQLYHEMIVEGIMALQAGEVPSVIRAKLKSMLSEEQQKRLLS